MFAYCLNSTILFRDDQGTRPVINSLEKETPQELAYSYAYMRTRLSISTTKTSGSWAASFGWEFGIAFGLRVSASQQIVFDSEGDFGVATTFFFGGGTPTIYAGCVGSYVKNDSIQGFQGTSWDVGGGSILLIGADRGPNTTAVSATIAPKSIPFELHGGLASTHVVDIVTWTQIQDDMSKYGSVW